MTMTRTTLATATLVAIAWSFVPSAPRAQDARAGGTLFAERCGACHGADARGQNGPNLTTLWTAGATDDRVFQTIRQFPAASAPERCTRRRDPRRRVRRRRAAGVAVRQRACRAPADRHRRHRDGQRSAANAGTKTPFDSATRHARAPSGTSNRTSRRSFAKSPVRALARQTAE